jgi:hypothetical protein
MPGKKKNRKGAASAPPAGARKPSLSRHRRGCTICRHPNRAVIEEDFQRWRGAGDIAEEHELHDRQSVYRHAHATGLWERRRRNLRVALESLIEGAERVRVTGDTIVRAVIAHARINDEGKYVEPPRHIVHWRDGKPAKISTRYIAQLENELSD